MLCKPTNIWISFVCGQLGVLCFKKRPSQNPRDSNSLKFSCKLQEQNLSKIKVVLFQFHRTPSSSFFQWIRTMTRCTQEPQDVYLVPSGHLNWLIDSVLWPTGIKFHGSRTHLVNNKDFRTDHKCQTKHNRGWNRTRKTEDSKGQPQDKNSRALNTKHIPELALGCSQLRRHKRTWGVRCVEWNQEFCSMYQLRLTHTASSSRNESQPNINRHFLCSHPPWSVCWDGSVLEAIFVSVTFV